MHGLWFGMNRKRTFLCNSFQPDITFWLHISWLKSIIWAAPSNEALRVGNYIIVGECSLWFRPKLHFGITRKSIFFPFFFFFLKKSVIQELTMADFKSHSKLCENVWQMCYCGDGMVARGHGVRTTSSSGSYSLRLLWCCWTLPCYTDLRPVVSCSPVKVNRPE